MVNVPDGILFDHETMPVDESWEKQDYKLEELKVHVVGNEASWPQYVVRDLGESELVCEPITIVSYDTFER